MAAEIAEVLEGSGQGEGRRTAKAIAAGAVSLPSEDDQVLYVPPFLVAPTEWLPGGGGGARVDVRCACYRLQGRCRGCRRRRNSTPRRWHPTRCGRPLPWAAPTT